MGIHLLLFYISEFTILDYRAAVSGFIHSKPEFILVTLTFEYEYSRRILPFTANLATMLLDGNVDVDVGIGPRTRDWRARILTVIWCRLRYHE